MPFLDESGSFKIPQYLRGIAKLPRLTVEEERELGLRIQCERDHAALTRLVECNLRFVVSYAKRYRGLGVPLLDLIHEGNLGLMEAARRFDPSRNVKFITYAVWWVRQSMMHALSDQTRAFSFPPKMFSTLHAGRTDVSLNDPVGAGGAFELGDLLAQDDVAPVDAAMIRRTDFEKLADALLELDGKERRSFGSASGSKTTSRARCRRSAIGCTSPASASGRSKRAPKRSSGIPRSFAVI